MWIVSRHEHVRAAARAHESLSSAESVTPTRSRVPMMIAMDRPEHARLRPIAARHFTREAIERFRPAIERIVRSALDDVPLGEPADAVARLTGPFPVEVIAEVLGVARTDRGRFREWSDRVVEGFGVAAGGHRTRTIRSVLGATFALHGYFAGAIEERRAAPGDDVLSHLIASSEDGRLSEDELFWFAVLLLVAGNETTTSLLGGMLLAFAEHPDQYARVREDPALIGATVEESLRYVSPLQGLYRTALRDHRVGEATIPAGGRVLLLFAAANRDPRRYVEPDRFVVDRDAADHVAFGYGIHFCLGAQLARVEAAVFLSELVQRVSRIEPAGEPAWSGNPSLRGLTCLPLRLS